MNELESPGVWIFWGLVGLGIAFGIARGVVARLRENAYNARLRVYLDGRDASFKAGFLTGRRWLAEFIAEAEQARDRRDDYLRFKSHPARKSAEIVREKIYHLPFDQQYDRTQVSRPGECYVATVREAEHHGFRRAWRHQARREG